MRLFTSISKIFSKYLIGQDFCPVNAHKISNAFANSQGLPYDGYDVLKVLRLVSFSEGF